MFVVSQTPGGERGAPAVLCTLQRVTALHFRLFGTEMLAFNLVRKEDMSAASAPLLREFGRHDGRFLLFC